MDEIRGRPDQCCTGTRSAFRRSGTRSEMERNEPEFVPDFARNGTENPEFVPNFVERNGTRSEKIGTEYNTDSVCCNHMLRDLHRSEHISTRLGFPVGLFLFIAL